MLSLSGFARQTFVSPVPSNFLFVVTSLAANWRARVFFCAFRYRLWPFTGHHRPFHPTFGCSSLVHTFPCQMRASKKRKRKRAVDRNTAPYVSRQAYSTPRREQQSTDSAAASDLEEKIYKDIQSTNAMTPQLSLDATPSSFSSSSSSASFASSASSASSSLFCDLSSSAAATATATAVALEAAFAAKIPSDIISKFGKRMVQTSTAAIRRTAQLWEQTAVASTSYYYSALERAPRPNTDLCTLINDTRRTVLNLYQSAYRDVDSTFAQVSAEQSAVSSDAPAAAYDLLGERKEHAFLDDGRPVSAISGGDTTPMTIHPNAHQAQTQPQPQLPTQVEAALPPALRVRSAVVVAQELLGALRLKTPSGAAAAAHLVSLVSTHHASTVLSHAMGDNVDELVHLLLEPSNLASAKAWAALSADQRTMTGSLVRIDLARRGETSAATVSVDLFTTTTADLSGSIKYLCMEVLDGRYVHLPIELRDTLLQSILPAKGNEHVIPFFLHPAWIWMATCRNQLPTKYFQPKDVVETVLPTDKTRWGARIQRVTGPHSMLPQYLAWLACQGTTLRARQVRHVFSDPSLADLPACLESLVFDDISVAAADTKPIYLANLDALLVAGLVPGCPCPSLVSPTTRLLAATSSRQLSAWLANRFGAQPLPPSIFHAWTNARHATDMWTMLTGISEPSDSYFRWSSTDALLLGCTNDNVAQSIPPANVSLIRVKASVLREGVLLDHHAADAKMDCKKKQDGDSPTSRSNSPTSISSNSSSSSSSSLAQSDAQQITTAKEDPDADRLVVVLDAAAFRLELNQLAANLPTDARPCLLTTTHPVFTVLRILYLLRAHRGYIRWPTQSPSLGLLLRYSLRDDVLATLERDFPGIGKW
jgi:hypothetical protein